MNAEKLRDLAIQALEDLKGIDIVTIDVKSLTTITDYMIICTGRSTRHIKALAENVAVNAKKKCMHLMFEPRVIRIANGY